VKVNGIVGVTIVSHFIMDRVLQFTIADVVSATAMFRLTY